MSHLSDVYNEAIIRARLSLTGPGGILDATGDLLNREFAAMLVAIVEDASAGRITAERAEQLSTQIIRRLRGLDSGLAAAFESARREAMIEMASAHAESLSAVAGRAGVEITATFADIPDLAIDLMMRRRVGLGISTNFRTLINRHVMDAADDIDRILTSAVARGQSIPETTRRIATAMARGDEGLLRTLSNLRDPDSRTFMQIAGDVEIPEGELARAKSLLYDSRRIAQTEINTALQEADNVAAMRSPVVGGVRWRRSSSHFKRDVCDALAEGDHYGLGPGVFPPHKVPAHPHPYDQCWTEKIVRPPEEWNDPNPDPGPPRRNDYEQILRDTDGDVTDASAKRNARLAREAIDLADMVAENAGLQRV